MAGWSSVGPHQYLVTEDLLFWRPGGEILPEHAEDVCRIVRQIIDHYRYALWLIDAAHSLPISHAARLIYARRLAQAPGRVAMAAFNAKLPAKTTGTLITRGIEMLAPGMLVYRSCTSEEEARTALAQLRADWKPTHAASDP